MRHNFKTLSYSLIVVAPVLSSVSILSMSSIKRAFFFLPLSNRVGKFLAC